MLSVGLTIFVAGLNLSSVNVLNLERFQLLRAKQPLARFSLRPLRERLPGDFRRTGRRGDSWIVILAHR